MGFAKSGILPKLGCKVSLSPLKGHWGCLCLALCEEQESWTILSYEEEEEVKERKEKENTDLNRCIAERTANGLPNCTQHVHGFAQHGAINLVPFQWMELTFF